MNEMNEAAFKEACRDIYNDETQTSRQKRAALQSLYREHSISDEILIRRYRKLRCERDLRENYMPEVLIAIIVGAFTQFVISGILWNGISVSGLLDVLLMVLWKAAFAVNAAAIAMIAVTILLYTVIVKGIMDEDKLLVRPYEIKLLEEKLGIYESQATKASRKVRKIRSSVMKKD